MAGKGFLNSQTSEDNSSIIFRDNFTENCSNGYSHEIHRRFSIEAGTTYWILDTSDIDVDYIKSLPIFGDCSNDQIYIDTYKVDSYTGGTAIDTIDSGDTAAKAIFKTGITPGATSSDPDLRQYIFGTQGQGNQNGGGSSSGNHPKKFMKGDLVCFEIVSTASLDFEFNWLWCEK